MGEQRRANAGRWTLWAPVALGLGAAAYLGLRQEPPLWLMAAIAAMGVLMLLLARRVGLGWLTLVATLFAFAGVGGLAGKARTLAVAAPIAPAGLGARAVEGWVVDVASPGGAGPRIVLAPVRIEGLAPHETPKRVRLTLDEAVPPGPGAAIRVRAVIHPPPAPASPGAYDFARNAWFDGVGGVGFSLEPPHESRLARPPWRLRAAMALNAARWSLARRIVERLGPSGGVAAAMATGQEAFVTAEQTAAMRDAGLAHIVSISGLHMAIVGGFVFGAVRLLLAAWPWAALRVSTKKVAAVAGLAAVGAYLALSGAPPPAERAAITAAVAFLAILADRRAISLHALAVAAAAVILIQPEAVAEPGFQMSFAATAALIALAEAWTRPTREIAVPWPIRFIQSAAGWVAVSVGASLVAGLATGPFAIQHFNRVATFGLLANLAVAPVASFVMMPALALGAALEPLGWGGPFLWAAGWSIDLMLAIAGRVAQIGGAALLIPSAPAFALPIAFLGILWLCLWRGPVRWIGLPLALAVNLCPRPPAPDVWIAADGSAAAVRIGGEAVLLRPDAKRFAADLWSRRRGLQTAESAQARRDVLFDCQRSSCRPRAGAPPVALAWGRRAPAPPDWSATCASASLVILRANPPPETCAAALLSADDFQRGGSAELWRTPEGWRVTWAQTLRGDRPWSRSE